MAPPLEAESVWKAVKAANGNDKTLVVAVVNPEHVHQSMELVKQKLKRRKGRK